MNVRAVTPVHTGGLLASEHSERDYDADGVIVGEVAWSRYPGNFSAANSQGFTWDRSPKGQHHTRGARRLHRVPEGIAEYALDLLPTYHVDLLWPGGLATRRSRYRRT